MTTEKSFTDVFNEVQGEVDAVQTFDDWEPPTGQHECLLLQYDEGSKKADDTDIAWPWFRVTLKIVDAVERGLDHETFSRMATTNPAHKGRAYRLKEMVMLAKALTGQELPVAKAHSAIKKAVDSQEAVVNVGVRYREIKKGDLRANYSYTPAGA